MPHTLAPLPYSYEALESFIDQETMKIHHDKHHQTYCDKFNTALAKYPQYAEMEPVELLTKLESLTDIEAKDKTAIKNHGGGFVNHSLFWQMMDPKNTKDEKLIAEIITAFGSVDEFKKKFSEIAVNHFASGWAWLVRDQEGKLQIYSLPNQDTPYAKGHTPILTLDLWEHAYYLKYQNKRADYIANWWQVIKLIQG
ncbi:MAG: superoxide dismutase [Candidatus Buchananbacteria bacterium]